MSRAAVSPAVRCPPPGRSAPFLSRFSASDYALTSSAVSSGARTRPRHLAEHRGETAGGSRGMTPQATEATPEMKLQQVDNIADSAARERRRDGGDEQRLGELDSESRQDTGEHRDLNENPQGRNRERNRTCARRRHDDPSCAAFFRSMLAFRAVAHALRPASGMSSAVASTRCSSPMGGTIAAAAAKRSCSARADDTHGFP